MPTFEELSRKPYDIKAEQKLKTIKKKPPKKSDRSSKKKQPNDLSSASNSQRTKVKEEKPVNTERISDVHTPPEKTRVSTMRLPPNTPFRVPPEVEVISLDSSPSTTLESPSSPEPLTALKAKPTSQSNVYARPSGTPSTLIKVESSPETSTARRAEPGLRQVVPRISWSPSLWNEITPTPDRIAVSTPPINYDIGSNLHRTTMTRKKAN